MIPHSMIINSHILPGVARKKNKRLRVYNTEKIIITWLLQVSKFYYLLLHVLVAKNRVWYYVSSSLWPAASPYFLM